MGEYGSADLDARDKYAYLGKPVVPVKTLIQKGK